jgi:hypothetical protein
MIMGVLSSGYINKLTYITDEL